MERNVRIGAGYILTNHDWPDMLNDLPLDETRAALGRMAGKPQALLVPATEQQNDSIEPL